MTANIENILDDSVEMCQPFFEKMSELRRGSMEHVKGRVGSFWGQSALSGKSRVMSIYSSKFDDNINCTPREDGIM